MWYVVEGEEGEKEIEKSVCFGLGVFLNIGIPETNPATRASMISSKQDPHSSRENKYKPNLSMSVQQRGTRRDLVWPWLELSRTSRR
jgi:hypothetical protein